MTRMYFRGAVCVLTAVFALSTSPSALAVNEFWVGTGNSNNWSDNGNWADNSAPVSPASLTFQDTTRLTPFNNLAGYEAGPTNGVAIGFSSTAGAFVLSGSAITLSGNVVNSSTNLQTINLP